MKLCLKVVRDDSKEPVYAWSRLKDVLIDEQRAGWIGMVIRVYKWIVFQVCYALFKK